MSMRQTPSYLSMFGFLFGMYTGYQIGPNLSLSSSNIQVCFTPGDNCTQLIVDQIDKTENDVRVQAYSFTSQPIVDALLRAHGRGARVRIILDKSNKDKLQLPAIRQILDKIPEGVKFDVLPGIAHNKVMLLDGILITGSFNFSKAAQFRNAENVLVINNSQIYDQYKVNWERRYNASFMLRDVVSDNALIGNDQSINKTTKTKRVGLLNSSKEDVVDVSIRKNNDSLFLNSKISESKVNTKKNNADKVNTTNVSVYGPKTVLNMRRKSMIPSYSKDLSLSSEECVLNSHMSNNQIV